MRTQYNVGDRVLCINAGGEHGLKTGCEYYVREWTPDMREETDRNDFLLVSYTPTGPGHNSSKGSFAYRFKKVGPVQRAGSKRLAGALPRRMLLLLEKQA